MKNVTALKNGTGDTLAEEGVLQVGKKGDGRLHSPTLNSVLHGHFKGLSRGRERSLSQTSFKEA